MNVEVRAGRAPRNFFFASAVSAALLLGVAAPASAGTLDQQQPSTAGGSFAIASDSSLAQSFTAGVSGGLDRADLYLTSFGTPAAAMNVEIRAVSGGFPSGGALASQSVPPSSISGAGGFVSFDFASPAPVVAGTQYAIVAYSSATFPDDDAWTRASGDPYGGGNSFINATSPPSGAWEANAGADFAFKTYVAPPIPVPPPANTGQSGKKKKCKHKKHKRSAESAKKKKCKKKKGR